MTGESVEPPSRQYDVIVLGGGAAGLICAFTAALRGRRVLVMEKSNKVGKKILMSGGGRCNFTNHFVDAENFISNNPHFSKSALNRYTQWDFISLVEKHGIEYEERKHSQLFCIHSAKDILSMLKKECALAGVDIRCNCDVSTVHALGLQDTGLRYEVQLVSGTKEDRQQSLMSCQSLIVATGALSVPTLGGSGLGYDIARQFGLPVTACRAGLVPFMFSDSMKPICERLSGIATAVEISCNGVSFTESMLFTHRGISGPAVLQVSNYWRPGDPVDINLLPTFDGSDLLLSLKSSQPKSRLRTVLNPHLPKALTHELETLWWPELTSTPLAEFNDKKLATIGEKLNRWQLKPSATEGFRTAEVTLGGVDTDGVSSKTLEAKAQPGLYFVGEVLDVTGHLGGFNFQWAWSSGYSAGMFV
ncbi:MAG: NAD(P)/FAD-dependent oxidoreductase [Halioglobus sp.]